MTDRLVLAAPAKVNLVLRVGPQRPDGLHRLATLFVALDLADELVVEPAAETAVEGFAEDTLVHRALAELGETRRVRLTKRIPVAAGLGGGSSDAAAILRALRGERDVNDLYAIARRLGADVPFFLSGAPSAIGFGAGDQLIVTDHLPTAYALVLVPSERGLSTAEVYAAHTPGDYIRAHEGALVRAVHTVRLAEDLAAMVVNDLEPTVLALRPDVGEALGALREAGALAAAVSGSGPTAFGVFRDRADAERAAAAIPGAIAASPARPPAG